MNPSTNTLILVCSVSIISVAAAVTGSLRAGRAARKGKEKDLLPDPTWTPGKNDIAEQAYGDRDQRLSEWVSHLRNSNAAAKKTGFVLVFVGLTLVLSFVVMEWLSGEHSLFVAAGAGLVPIVIGIGSLLDAKMQFRDVQRLVNRT